MSIEQREHPRYPIHLQVQYQDHAREMIIPSRDISAGGTFLATATPPEPGTSVSLSIDLPDGGGTVWAVGAVVHRIPGRGMGIAFSRFGPGSRERLLRYLQRLQG